MLSFHAAILLLFYKYGALAAIKETGVDGYSLQQGLHREDKKLSKFSLVWVWLSTVEHRCNGIPDS